MTPSQIIGGSLATAAIVALAFGSGAEEPTPDPTVVQEPDLTTEMAEPSASTSSGPITEPSICSFESGRWCDACTSCPQADTGWLCCNSPSGACVPIAIDGVCSEALGNVKGHCENYDVDPVTGNADCHDV